MTETQFDFQNRPHPKDLSFSRTFKARRQLVFEAFTRAEHLIHWWAPKPFTTHRCQVDLRPGGAWTYSFRSPEGTEHDCRAVYEEVVIPQKLVIVQAVPDPKGHLFFKIRQTIVFKERGDETELNFTVKVLEANQGSEPFLGGMEQGTKMTLNNLAEYLEGIK